jgi:hypothetical protein
VFHGERLLDVVSITLLASLKYRLAIEWMRIAMEMHQVGKGAKIVLGMMFLPLLGSCDPAS